jgi:hypothetical protein
MVNEFALSEEVKIYLLVGRAISEWASLEDSMAHMLQAALRIPWWKAHNIFWSVNSVQTRISIISNCLQADMRMIDRLPFWKSVAKEIAILASDRNKIAHWRLWHVLDQGRGTEEYFLAPNFGDYASSLGKRDELLLSDDIELITEEIRRATFYINELFGSMTEPPVTQLASLQLYYPPETMRSRRLLRTTLERPPPHGSP